MAAGNNSPLSGRATPTPDVHDNQADFRADMDLLGDEVEGLPPDDDGEEGQPPARPPKPPARRTPAEGADEGEGDGEEGDEGEERPDEDGEEEGEEGEEGEENAEEELDVVGDPLRPTYKDIKTAYPDFFKKFPEMRHMIFREQEYTNLFPTVENAKEASEQSTDFKNFQSLLSSGEGKDFNEFLNGVAKGGPDMLTNMAANFLPSLYSVNRDMYFAITSPIVESMLRSAYTGAGTDENLKNAALHLAKWALGDYAFATGDKRSAPLKAAKQETPKDDRYEQEKQQFYAQRYTEARTYVSDVARARLTREILKGLDPNNTMRKFTKDAAVRQIFDELSTTLEGDKRHMNIMNALWEQGHKAGFTGNWKDRITTTYLSGARALMPAIRAKIREAALGDETNHQEQRGERAERSRTRKDVPSSGNAGSGQRGPQAPGASEIDWSKTSDMDILSGKYKLKGK